MDTVNKQRIPTIPTYMSAPNIKVLKSERFTQNLTCASLLNLVHVAWGLAMCLTSRTCYEDVADFTTLNECTPLFQRLVRKRMLVEVGTACRWTCAGLTVKNHPETINYLDSVSDFAT